jgi:CP family cyanate transporter-like MFS transporter
VAWLAHRAGGWQWTWVATLACSLVGMLAVARLAALRQRLAATTTTASNTSASP